MAAVCVKGLVESVVERNCKCSKEDGEEEVEDGLRLGSTLGARHAISRRKHSIRSM